jgi:Uma2 family endonuclease
MSYAPTMQTVTEDEYLAFENASRDVKHEFINGRIVAMSGGTARHAAISGRLIYLLGDRLRGSQCAALPSDMRVHVPATGLYTYPDISIVSAEVKMHTKDKNSLVSPTMLIEVLSPSTEAYDRGAKFHHYQSIPTLREYLLVASEERSIDHYRRLPEGRWELTTHERDDDIVRLPTLGIELPLAEIYEGTDRFPL